MQRRMAFAAWVGLLAACGGDGGENASRASGSAAPTTAAPPTAAAFDARQTFSTVCATCHGVAGLGDGPAGMALTPRPANFTAPDFWVDRNDQVLFQAIKEGGASVGRSPLMAPWGASFNDDQIRQLVEVVKGFRPATAP